MELKDEICSFCGAHCLKTTERRINSRGEKMPWLKNQDGSDHKCLSTHKSEKDVYIKGSSEIRGFPCYQKCKTYVVKDEKLPKPRLREVIKKLKGISEIECDIENGKHHTVQRCIAIKEFKHIPLTEEQETCINIMKLNEYNLKIAEYFNPDTQWWPSDLFILTDFEDEWHPVYVRNPKYHDKIGYYIGPKSNLTRDKAAGILL